MLCYQLIHVWFAIDKISHEAYILVLITLTFICVRRIGSKDLVVSFFNVGTSLILCSGLHENGPHWHLFESFVPNFHGVGWEGSGNGPMLEQVSHWGWSWGFKGPSQAHCLFLGLLLADEDVSFQLLLQDHDCLSPAMLYAMVVMDSVHLQPKLQIPHFPLEPILVMVFLYDNKSN